MQPKTMGRPRTAPPSRTTALRMPLDVLEKLDELKRDLGLSYTEIITSTLRKSFGLASPTEQLESRMGEKE